MPCFAWNFHSASPLLGNCAKFWPIWRNRRAEADNSPNFPPPLRAALQRWNTPAANRVRLWELASLADAERLDIGSKRLSARRVWCTRGGRSGQLLGEPRNAKRNGDQADKPIAGRQPRQAAKAEA